MKAIHEVIEASAPRRPARLTAILAISGTFASGAKALRLLSEQSAVADIELLLFSESRSILDAAAALLAPFASFQRILGDTSRLPSLRTEALALARSPIIAYCEDHSFLEPSWGSALLNSFDSDARVLAVAPAFINPNPDHPISRALFTAHFGPWDKANWPCGEQPIDALPWHNTAYRRADLIALGAEVAQLLVVECHLQQAVKKLHPDGILIFNTTTATHHANASLLSAACRQALVGGRLFAAERWVRSHWSLGRRLIQAAASPLIPILRLWRSRAMLNQSAQGDLLELWAYAWIIALFHAAGEATGNLFGIGDSIGIYSNFECRRARFVRYSDQAILFD
jgi:hypothetical protein